MEWKDKIVYYAYKYSGDWTQIAEAIKNNEEICDCVIEDKYITVFDEKYPECLKRLRFPPWILFYEGNLDLLNEECISIVGSREATKYGEGITRLIVRNNLDKVIVSGLAKGIDAIAHDEAIKKGKTIGIIGCGLKNEYPLSNKYLYDILKKEHLIISEYPYFVKAKKHHFPWRNRLIAALGKEIYVTQAKIKSGTMLTVNEAINLSKEIYVAPYPLFVKEGEGCNLLISQGANIILELNKDLKESFI